MPSKLMDLSAHPLVAAVEADQQGEAPGRGLDGDPGVASPSVIVPLGGPPPATTWNLDLADTDAEGFDGSTLARMLQKNPHLSQEESQFILRATALHLPADPDGLATPLQFVSPWGPEAVENCESLLGGY